MTRTVVLVERRAVEHRVPRRDVAELAARFGHVVAVEPGRGRYRLTPRGYAGWFETATVRWVVRPKLAWANLARLLGTPSVSPATAFPDRFAALVADRLAALMRERAAAGLHREYREHREESATVRGRIDFAELARRSGPPGAAFPLVVSDLSADSPWNRVPVAAARRVLAVPGLAAESRANLAAAAETFAAAGVGDGADSDRELAGLTFTPATEPYRPLIAWCRVALGDGGLLVSLEHAFEEYVARVLGTPGNPAIDRHPDLRLTCDAGPAVRLVPDFVVRRGENPVAVWDAKWKRLTASGPDPADVQQVLGYAAVLGVRDAGLVYPGRRSGVMTFSGGAGVRLRVVKLRVSGPDAACDRAAARLRRTVNFS